MVPLDSDPSVGCFVLTGLAKAFAAGADIAEMQDRTYPDAFLTNMLEEWEAIAQLRTPKIAAVSGLRLRLPPNPERPPWLLKKRWIEHWRRH